MNPRIMSWLSLILLALLMAVRAARAASNMDSAANYPGGWESGSNGGGGFEAWALDSYAGDGWAGGGIWDSLEADLNMGTCFGFGARGTDAVFTASRDFSTPMTNGDLLKLDLGLNYDTGGTGNKGFLLYTTDAGEIILVNMADSGTITVNGNDALVDYGTGTMHWTITQISATQVLVYATGRTGSEAYVDVFDLGQESHLAGIKFYASGGTNDEYYAYRQVYFDNLILSQDSVGTAGYTYSIESNRAVIQSVDTSISGHILIPATLGGYPVGAIGRSAFINCTGITGIVFPENTMVDTIGPNAFQGCTGLLYATLPDALVELSPGLFYGCKNLLAVTIPDSVLHIGAGAFAQCENLQTIDLPAGLSILDESA